jgi:hypothetical protein
MVFNRTPIVYVDLVAEEVQRRERESRRFRNRLALENRADTRDREQAEPTPEPPTPRA